MLANNDNSSTDESQAKKTSIKAKKIESIDSAKPLSTLKDEIASDFLDAYLIDVKEKEVKNGIIKIYYYFVYTKSGAEIWSVSRRTATRVSLVSPLLFHVPRSIVKDEQDDQYIVFEDVRDNTNTAIRKEEVKKFLESHLISSSKKLDEFNKLLQKTVDFNSIEERDDLKAGFNDKDEFIYNALLTHDFTVFKNISHDFKEQDVQDYYDALAFLYENKVATNIVLSAEFLATIYHFFENLEAARPLIHMYEPAGGYGKSSFARQTIKAVHGTTNAIREAASDTQVSILRAAAAARDSLLVIDEFQNFYNSEKRRELVMQLSSGKRTKARNGSEKLQINTFRNATLLISNTPADQLLSGTATHVALSRIIDIDISKISFADSYIDDKILIEVFEKLEKCAGLFKRDIVSFVQEHKSDIVEKFSVTKERLMSNVTSDNKRIVSNVAMFSVSQLFLSLFLQEKTTLNLKHVITSAVSSIATSAINNNEYSEQKVLEDLQVILNTMFDFTHVVGYYNAGNLTIDEQIKFVNTHNQNLKNRYIKVKFESKSDEEHSIEDAEYIAISNKYLSVIRDETKVDVDKLIAFCKSKNYCDVSKQVKLLNRSTVFHVKRIVEALQDEQPF